MWKYLSVYLLSAIKFIFGPTMGFAAGLSFFETFFLTIAGTMTSVFIFSHLAIRLRERMLKRFYKPKADESKKGRRIVKIWKSYGAFGVSFLTPLIFSPIGGTLILTAFGVKKSTTFLFMLISAIIWGLVLCYLIYELGYRLI